MNTDIVGFYKQDNENAIHHILEYNTFANTVKMDVYIPTSIYGIYKKEIHHHNTPLAVVANYLKPLCSNEWKVIDSMLYYKKALLEQAEEFLII